MLGTPEGRKELRHPQVGTLVFEHTTFVVSSEPALHMVLYTPLPEHDTERKLVQLLSTTYTDASCRHSGDKSAVSSTRSAQVLS